MQLKPKKGTVYQKIEAIFCFIFLAELSFCLPLFLDDITSADKHFKASSISDQSSETSSEKSSLSSHSVSQDTVMKIPSQSLVLAALLLGW